MQLGGLKGGSEMLSLALWHWVSAVTVILFHIKVNVIDLSFAVLLKID